MAPEKTKAAFGRNKREGARVARRTRTAIRRPSQKDTRYNVYLDAKDANGLADLIQQLGASIRGVIFDMDGVLCDSEPFIAEAAGRMFAERYGLKVTPKDFRPFIGTGENRFLGGVAEKYGVTLALPSDKDRTYAIYLELIHGRLSPLPGARDFVAECRRRALVLAIATSADRVKLEGNLREIGFPPELFAACVTGSEVEHKKPAPDIFLTAARKARLKPATTLVIEDAPNGVQAAKAAGMRALALTTSFSAAVLRSSGADWTAPDLSQVLPGV